jgi:hypothetical protein
MDWSCTLRLLGGVILTASLGFAEKKEEEGRRSSIALSNF